MRCFVKIYDHLEMFVYKVRKEKTSSGQLDDH